MASIHNAPRKFTISSDGDTLVALDPAVHTTVTIDITGTISIEFQYPTGLLNKSPSYVASATITGIVADATYVLDPIPGVKIVASGTSGGTAVIGFTQRGNIAGPNHYSAGADPD